MPDDTDQPTLTVRVDADTRPMQEDLIELAKLGKQFSTALSSSFVDIALKGKGLGDVLRARWRSTCRSSRSGRVQAAY